MAPGEKKRSAYLETGILNRGITTLRKEGVTISRKKSKSRLLGHCPTKGMRSRR